MPWQYTQLIFSLLIDYTVWGATPRMSSILGSALIIGAAIWISLQKKSASERRETPARVDEESPLLSSENERAHS